MTNFQLLRNVCTSISKFFSANWAFLVGILDVSFLIENFMFIFNFVFFTSNFIFRRPLFDVMLLFVHIHPALPRSVGNRGEQKSEI